ncbi:unnamed protein product [Periconia digitata]|uniref:Uncharacterized protein n=1 Tax=Periconia digitata TaxID=1303443 RepID=A0A9W4XH77_9PLEO|nr:unnamed protein product [Periconia digitata]
MILCLSYPDRPLFEAVPDRRERAGSDQGRILCRVISNTRDLMFLIDFLCSWLLRKK